MLLWLLEGIITLAHKDKGYIKKSQGAGGRTTKNLQQNPNNPAALIPIANLLVKWDTWNKSIPSDSCQTSTHDLL